ncbi:MAG: DUF305 domain-containing protein [Rhodothermales bacterium]
MKHPIFRDQPAVYTSLQSFLPVFLVLVLTGCAGSSPRGTGTATPETEMQDSSNTARLEQLYWARIEADRSKFTQADVDFMTGMIGHHAQALIMSDYAEPNGASPELQILAARIINAQKDEIATMERWLRLRGQDVPDAMAAATDHAHHMHMPGMLSAEQLTELAAARGAEFDRLYLTYMIQHHRGAVTMVEKLFSTDGAGQDEDAFRLATDINVDQITEIARMERMLESLSPPN